MFYKFIMLYTLKMCLFFIGLTYAEVQITSHKELTDVAFNGFLSCVSELNLNPDECGDFFDPKLDHNDKKYDGCKCLLPCVAKKIGTMNIDDGKWNKKKYFELVSLLEIPSWKEEAEIIGKNCEDDVNSHCSAGYPLIQCIMKHSKMIQTIAQNYMNQKQAEINAANNNDTDVEYEDEINDQTKN